jgi:hypothetical protein
MLTNLSVQQLRQAANLKEQIEALNKELGAIIGFSAPSKPAKRKMSAGHIAKIRAAQKLRWAKVRAAKPVVKAAVKPAVVKAAVKPATKKGTISAAGIARIKAAQKARWAVINAAKAKAAPKAAVVAVKPVSVAKPVVKTAVKPAKKFTMSAEAKAKISAAAKARWAAVRAAKKK